MMTDFLLELRSEEIPARMQDKARDDLSRLFAAELAKAGIAATRITTFATPRRLALIAHGLPDATEAVAEEVKGPRAAAPHQALEGFLRKTGLTREQLTERDGVLYAITERPGRATATVLADAVPAIIRAFPWPKSMRWGDASTSTESLRWVRPLHGIVALFGDAVVPLEIAGIASGRDTRGHRFHHQGAVTIGSAADYAATLRAAYVIVDQDERRAIVRDGAARLATAAGLVLVEDEGLVGENAGLTEWPVPLLGRFDPAFLDVPPEVIQLTARVNQKYFVCRDGDGRLADAFVCTANIAAPDGGARIVEGNRKVLAARLSDARFFYDTDLKVPLDEQAAKLAKIVFHEKLGTVADKVDRVAKLARWLVEQGIVGSPDDAVLAARAARLAKADLVTGMVGEFPELQGVIGGYYAAAQGEDARVAAAVRDHYKPVGQGDEVPTDPVTVAVSLADKLDTLVGFFRNGQFPTGSKDPFALRRAAIGVIGIISDNGLRLSLRTLIDEWRKLRRTQQLKSMAAKHSVLSSIEMPETIYMFGTASSSAGMSFPIEETLFINNKSYGAYKAGSFDDVLALFNASKRASDTDNALLDFFADRLKVQQREAGVRHDLIDAVFALGGEDDLVRLLARVRALQSFVTTDDGANLLAGYKRAANILKKEEFAAGATNPAPEPAEAALIAALDMAEPRAAAAVAAEDFEGAMAALATLRTPIDAFFDQVTVNAADPTARAARLGLLDRVRRAVHEVADFSKIEG